MSRIRDWAAETPESIAARLEGVKTSQGQTRLTLGIMALVSMMMIITAYNAYFSYDYGWILDNARDHWRSTAPEIAGTVSEILTTQALKDWAASRTANSSLLGIRVSVDDSAVLGTGVLFVLSLWLLLVTRRENHTIGFLLRDTDSPRPGEWRHQTTATASQDAVPHGQRWLIFHTILSNSIFVTFDDSLASVESLDDPKPPASGRVTTLKATLSRQGFKAVRGFFFLFPVITSFVVFGIDRWSYFIPDPFAPGAQPPGLITFYYQSMAIFIVCFIPLAVCCTRARRYSTATQTVLREYGNKLREDLLKTIP
jgi:hypothetical protein